MTEPTSASGAGPSVCPFVALAEDRDRRGDAPDDGNRCYAERAPRRRDLAYQADYCYSSRFAACSVFLAWAARNAAEPAYVTDAATRAWGSGIAAPEEPPARADGGEGSGAEPLPAPTPEGGLFGPADPSEAGEARSSERLDWISASAWAEAPWDERAEREAEEVELLAAAEAEAQAQAEDDETEEPPEAPEEATTAPKVPAALPMRRRKAPQQPIRSRGSGEWIYADPPGRQPLVSRGRGVTAPVLLGVLGLLVVAIVVFLLATTLGGGDEDPLTAATSPTPAASPVTPPTAAPVVTPVPTAEPSPTAEPKRRFYRVKAGDTLSGIAARFDVKENHLACLNGITNKNIVVIGDRYEIPPEGFSCPRGWRNATPEP